MPDAFEGLDCGEVLRALNVDESMLSEVNFLREPTPCSMNESFLLASFESVVELVWWEAMSLVGVPSGTVGVGTLVGR